MPKPYKMAQLRFKAQRAAMKKTNEKMYRAAVDIVAVIKRYNEDLTKVSFASRLLQSAIDRIVDNLAKDVAEITARYAKAIETATGEKLGVVVDYLGKAQYGATLMQRCKRYALRFRDDILRMVLAASKLGKPWTYVSSVIRTGYRNPYLNTAITKALRLTGDSRLAAPSYGKGIYIAAYRQMKRNVEDTIALAWGEHTHEMAKKDGMDYFIPHRGSSYPCELCDSHAEREHKMNEPHPPYHNNCVCWVEYKKRT